MAKSGKHINNYDLPQHEPNPELWDNIEQGLENLEAAGEFKNSPGVLPVHEPSSHLWDNIEVKLKGDKPGILFTPLKKAAIVIVALLLLLVPAYFFINNKVGKTTTNESPATKTETITENDKLKNVEDSPAPKERKPKASLSNPSEISEAEINTRTKEPVENNIASIAVINEKEVASYPGINSETGTIEIINTPAWDIVKTNAAITRPTFLAFESQFGYLNSRSFDSLIPLRKDIPAKANITPINFYAGIHYTPGLVYENGEIGSGQKEHTMGIDVGYKFNGFFIESGMGLNYTQQDATYEIEFLQNELVYTYTKVDSIVYQIDTAQATLIRNYITSDVDIYDSINYSENTKTTNQYSYLRVPLLIGYKFEFRKVSFFLKGGALFSVLLKGDAPVPTVDGKALTITNIDRVSPFMVTTKWQVMLSAGVAVPLNKLVMFAVEPQFRYSLKTYSDQNLQYNKKPYSIGVKAGLLINF